MNINVNNRKVIQDRQKTKQNQQAKILNEGQKPNYICVGVQKAGTTSLINYLNEHPDIFIKPTESHFFDKPKSKKLTITDFKHYEKRFITLKQFVGEKTPSYCYLPYAINRIYQYNPNMKLIIILREPISRLFSQYNMYKNNHNPKARKKVENTLGKEIKNSLQNEITKPTNPKTLTSNGKHYIVRSRYIEQIEHILTKFSKNQLYIGISEQIRANKAVEYQKIADFITEIPTKYLVNTIDDGNIQQNKPKQNKDTNIGKYTEKIDPDIEKQLYDYFKPYNERLYQLLGNPIPEWEEYYKSRNLK